jgi:hypothetical protein
MTFRDAANQINIKSYEFSRARVEPMSDKEFIRTVSLH